MKIGLQNKPESDYERMQVYKQRRQDIIDKQRNNTASDCES